MKDLNILPQKNVFFRLNHTSLLRAILMFCNVPVEKYDDVFAMVTDYMVSIQTYLGFVDLRVCLNSILFNFKQNLSNCQNLIQML